MSLSASSLLDTAEPSQETAGDVERALDRRLPPGQRQVVTAISVEGRRPVKPRKALGMKETVVRGGLHRVLIAIARKRERNDMDSQSHRRMRR